MRPEELYPLFTPIEALHGVGQSHAKKLEKLGLVRIIDLLWHLPVKVLDRRYMPKISEAVVNNIATIKLRIDKIEKSPNPKSPWRIHVSDTTGHMVISYFRASSAWIEKTFPIGSVRVVSGHVENRHGILQMNHPDYIGSIEDLPHIARLQPVWSLTAGITGKYMERLVNQALMRVKDLPEWQDETWLKRQFFPNFSDCLYALHHPDDEKLLSAEHTYRKRLAYDEVLAHQLALRLIRQHLREKTGTSIVGDGHLISAIIKQLPFDMTQAQKRCIKEIAADMQSPHKMVRLLQGDVGAGKTLVALMAMAVAVEAGYQAAMMVPTELLARQHIASIMEMIKHTDIHAVILTGKEKGKKRKEILAQIASGEANIIIGTHALIQEDVEYHKLALAIIDEQHRFGVHQRVQLLNKGQATDLLVMTATPIPRSLMLSVWGDMESSKLDEKPKGRKPIITTAMPAERLYDVIEALSRAMAQGNKIYWVCPLVDESEKIDLAAAEDRYITLKDHFGEGKVALVHGKMKMAEKDEAMMRFKDGDASLLVATTVIEVGVDVPEATIMVIEHAERFGLAQLHQLRGRVGRSDAQSSCILLYDGPLGHVSKERLKIMRSTNDGFVIAEKDLELRGSGDILGSRQSGIPQFKFMDLELHKDLMFAAADDVKLILHNDPKLQTARGQALRTLLYLFEKDSAIDLLQSG